MVDQVHLFQAKPGRLLLVSNSHTFIAQKLHPMTLFVIATAALNHDSKFAAAYSARVKKTDYWKSTLEDLLNLAAMTYPIAARIYVSKYKGGASSIPAIKKDRDLSWNYAQQIGMGNSHGFIEAVKLYNALHTNHDGGNVSSHTTYIVGSALSDPFLSYSAALGGLAGPLHGLANQEELRFVLEMKKVVGP
ncbi:citrate synthase [Phakopsora pachyrhizi]|nr:citrate synthase [Phakopsora pachyrhizi]